MLLFTKHQFFLEKMIMKMIHVRHHEIYIVSPYIELAYLSQNHVFGRFLFRAREEGTSVSIITRPPRPVDFEPFELLEASGINVGFLDDLHSKLYIFDVDVPRLGVYSRGTRRSAILGSANMTEPGWGLTTPQLSRRNEEICYLLPDDAYRQARGYAQGLQRRARELSSVRMRAIAH